MNHFGYEWEYEKEVCEHEFVPTSLFFDTEVCKKCNLNKQEWFKQKAIKLHSKGNV